MVGTLTILLGGTMQYWTKGTIASVRIRQYFYGVVCIFVERMQIRLRARSSFYLAAGGHSH